MSSKIGIINFVEYFSKPLSNEQIIYLNNLNNIDVKRLKLYEDFVVSLLTLINVTYLGDEIITDADKIDIHFNWCWEKNIDNFNKEKVKISLRGEHYYYFRRYTVDGFYMSTDKSNEYFDKVIDFWYTLMAINRVKTRSQYDLFVECYKLLDKHFFV